MESLIWKIFLSLTLVKQYNLSYKKGKQYAIMEDYNKKEIGEISITVKAQQRLISQFIKYLLSDLINQNTCYNNEINNIY